MFAPLMGCCYRDGQKVIVEESSTPKRSFSSEGRFQNAETAFEKFTCEVISGWTKSKLKSTDRF